MEKKKRRWGDRKDGVLLRDLDGMHFITPLIYPNRCDNEAYIRETIDLTNMNAYLKKKNETETEFPYTMFHLIVAALVKTITLRPKMNRFIANKNFYQRNEVSMSFVVKKQFADEAAEALAVKNACLLSHHGVLAAGKSLQAALTLAVEVENLAHQYVVVCQLGKPKLISYEEMNEVLRSFRTYGQQSVEGESK